MDAGFCARQRSSLQQMDRPYECEMADPIQGRLCYSRWLLSVGADSSRQRVDLEHHRLPLNGGANVDIHALDRLRVPQASERRESSRTLGEVDAAVASGSKASHYHTRLSCSSSTTFQLTSISASSANWGALVRVLVIIIAVVWYVALGNKHYTSPVDFVEGKKAAVMGLQSSRLDGPKIETDGVREKVEGLLKPSTETDLDPIHLPADVVVVGISNLVRLSLA